MGKLGMWLSYTLAQAVFTRSPSAYEALRSFKLLQLPSVHTLKYYTDANIEEASECMKRLEDERKCYLVMVESKSWTWTEEIAQAKYV